MRRKKSSKERSTSRPGRGRATSMSVRKKGSEVKCTDATRRDRASERVAANVGRGDLHPDVVAVDEGDVVGH